MRGPPAALPEEGVWRRACGDTPIAPATEFASVCYKRMLMGGRVARTTTTVFFVLSTTHLDAIKPKVRAKRSKRRYFFGWHLRWGTRGYRRGVTGETLVDDFFFTGDSCIGLDSMRSIILRKTYFGDSGLL
jgi:hypothetical protein